MCRLILRESETISLALRLQYVMAVAENRVGALEPPPSLPDKPVPTPPQPA